MHELLDDEPKLRPETGTSGGYALRRLRPKALRIGIVAPPWFAVPPERYGGTEAVVHLLAEGLVRVGHDVTLFASGDSSTSARLVSRFPQGRSDELGQTVPELSHALPWLRECEHLDVISDHSGPLGLMLSNLTETPFVHTVHGAPSGELGELYSGVCEATPTAALVALTKRHGATAPHLPWAFTIPNAIALDDHPCRARAGGEYLLWLGRMSADKGPVTAIEVARAAGMPLLLAGKLRAASEQRYFDREVRPLLGRGISYLGEIGPAERVRLLRRAVALINPIAWEEPFGLVMVEAMACGVPVIATPVGSVPEIVIDGVTGWIASTVEELALAVGRCQELDPRACRAVAEERFSPERMVRRYSEAFLSVIAARRRLRHAPLQHDLSTASAL
jgi:glycosyltransferase involved in cell wall biosynthesis